MDKINRLSAIRQRPRMRALISLQNLDSHMTLQNGSFAMEFTSADVDLHLQQAHQLRSDFAKRLWSIFIGTIRIQVQKLTNLFIVKAEA